MTKVIVILSKDTIKVPSADEVHIILNNSLPMKTAIKVINSIDSSRVRMYEVDNNDIVTGILIERITKGNLKDVTFVCDKDVEKKIRDGFDALDKESAATDEPEVPVSERKPSKKVKEVSEEIITEEVPEEIEKTLPVEVTEPTATEAPKKRHRRTKAEMEATRKAKEEESAMEANKEVKETKKTEAKASEKRPMISSEVMKKINNKEKDSEVFTKAPKEKVKIEPVILSGKGKAVAKKLPKELKKYSAIVIQVVEGMINVPEDVLSSVLRTKLKMEMSLLVGADDLEAEVDAVYAIVSSELGIN